MPGRLATRSRRPRANVPMMSSVEELAERLQAALEPIADVRLVYLFGSVVSGRCHGESDLDVGVVYPRELDGWARERLRREIVAALTDALGRLGERADVVDLERVPGALALDAVRRGRRLIVRDQGERCQFEALAVKRSDDEAGLRELRRRCAIAAAREMAGDRRRA